VKVVLIAPPTPNLSPAYFGPPYALAIFGALLKREGHGVACYDWDRDTLAQMLDDVPAMLARDAPDLVGISCISVNRVATFQLTKRLKALAPELPVVVGGAYPSVSPLEFLERSPVDFVCFGEGEVTLLELIEALGSGRDVARVPGLVTRRGRGHTFALPRDDFQDLDSLPFPDFELFGMGALLRRYAEPAQDVALERVVTDGRRGYLPQSAIMLIASRGCIFKCTFCPMSKKTPRVRAHSAGYVADMVVHMRDRFGHTDFVMGDNLFTFPRERAWALCEALLDRGAGVNWICMTRADMVDPPLLAKMREAGCREISYGIETLSWDVQRAMAKNLKTDPTARVFRQTHGAGIQSNLMLMIGNEGESRASLRATAAGCRDIRPDRVLLNVAKVYPGTLLYDRALRQGMFEEGYEDLEDPPVRDFTLETGAEELRYLARMINHRTIYLRAPPLLARRPDTHELSRFTGAMTLRCERAIWDIVGLDDVRPLIPALQSAIVNKVRRVWIHTDARFLTSAAQRRVLTGSGVVHGVVVPLFALDAGRHDAVVGRAGAFREAIRGLYRWTKSKGRARVWVYLDTRAGGCGEEQFKALATLGLEGVMFIYGQDPAGWYTTPVEHLPPLAQAEEAVAIASEMAADVGLAFEVTGLPECHLDLDPISLQENWRPFDEELDPISGRARSLTALRQSRKFHPPACSTCALRAHCEGLPAGGESLGPIRPLVDPPAARPHPAAAAASV